MRKPANRGIFLPLIVLSVCGCVSNIRFARVFLLNGAAAAAAAVLSSGRRRTCAKQSLEALITARAFVALHMHTIHVEMVGLSSASDAHKCAHIV